MFRGLTIVVTSSGAADATNLVVDDPLPGSVGYVSDTCAGTYVAAIDAWS